VQKGTSLHKGDEVKSASKSFPLRKGL